MDGDASQALEIRKRVLGLGRDALDGQAWQAVAFREDIPVGTGRLWWEEGEFRIGEVCVLDSERGQGFGDLLVRMLLFQALSHGARVIALRSPLETRAFFARYGFRETPGESGRMSIPADEVRLSHCGGDCARCTHPSDECLPEALR